MKLRSFQMSWLFVAVCSISSFSYADEETNLETQEQQRRAENLSNYTTQVGDKAFYGATNMASALLEIPKSMINITNKTDNYAYGFIGGLIEGTINTTGRFLFGLSDVVTAPVLTERVIVPEYIWDDFDSPTIMNSRDVFRLKKDFNVKQVSSDIYTESSEFASEVSDGTVSTANDIGYFFENLFEDDEDELSEEEQNTLLNFENTPETTIIKQPTTVTVTQQPSPEPQDNTIPVMIPDDF